MQVFATFKSRRRRPNKDVICSILMWNENTHKEEDGINFKTNETLYKNEELIFQTRDTNFQDEKISLMLL